MTSTATAVTRDWLASGRHETQFPSGVERMVNRFHGPWRTRSDGGSSHCAVLGTA